MFKGCVFFLLLWMKKLRSKWDLFFFWDVNIKVFCFSIGIFLFFGVMYWVLILWCIFLRLVFVVVCLGLGCWVVGIMFNFVFFCFLFLFIGLVILNFFLIFEVFVFCFFFLVIVFGFGFSIVFFLLLLYGFIFMVIIVIFLCIGYNNLLINKWIVFRNRVMYYRWKSNVKFGCIVFWIWICYIKVFFKMKIKIEFLLKICVY